MKLAPQTFVVSLLALLILQGSWVKAQPTIIPIPGYREVLNKRFGSGTTWFSSREANLNDLVGIVLSKKNTYNQIVPLRFVDAGDTTIVFYYSKHLPKLIKRAPARFTYVKTIPTGGFAKMPQRELISKSKMLNYDSIFRWMTSNMLINSSLFDLDTYLDADVNSFCYRPKGYNDSLVMIYCFFINGILVAEDRGSGWLVCLPY
jgi:hypothetical protein